LDCENITRYFPITGIQTKKIRYSWFAHEEVSRICPDSCSGKNNKHTESIREIPDYFIERINKKIGKIF